MTAAILTRDVSDGQITIPAGSVVQLWRPWARVETDGMVAIVLPNMCEVRTVLAAHVIVEPDVLGRPYDHEMDGL